MHEDIEFCIEETKESMGSAVSFFEKELSKIRAGKATPQMLDSIKIDYYGVQTPLSQVSNINTPDPKLIVIQPWEKSIIVAIEKAILSANLGFNPQSDGELIRIKVPPLTEERRRELVKSVKIENENAKIKIRNLRRTANETAKKLEKEGAAED